MLPVPCQRYAHTSYRRCNRHFSPAPRPLVRLSSIESAHAARPIFRGPCGGRSQIDLRPGSGCICVPIKRGVRSDGSSPSQFVRLPADSDVNRPQVPVRRRTSGFRARLSDANDKRVGLESPNYHTKLCGPTLAHTLPPHASGPKGQDRTEAIDRA
jgi:hypothetical protein